MSDFSQPPALEHVQEPHKFNPTKNVVLFVLTAFSVFLTGKGMVDPEFKSKAFLEGWVFAVPLLLILLFHEFGHWLAAKAHRVPASLPYFLPLPRLSFLGTMGAVIIMPERIRSRDALLDIGAAGPLAGMLVAIPTMVIGLRLSEVLPQADAGYIQEGQCLLYWAIKRMVLGPIPEGYDVYLHPTAVAAWGGFLITMINLLPWGQLDGGHIAFALFGKVHHGMARWLRRSLLLLYAYNLYTFVVPVLNGSSSLPMSMAIGNSMFWLSWFGVTWILGRFFGGFEHPPVEPGPLSTSRKTVAVSCLVLFILLFMPVPIAMY